ncbi:MAG: hypothetical protein KatS3mg049_0294 [Caldilinea sp.]|jgi:hypothetical protein|nr:MAG: hypothetical protein KatS3mg049_0294 [Caldilinea sp.]
MRSHELRLQQTDGLSQVSSPSGQSTLYALCDFSSKNKLFAVKPIIQKSNLAAQNEALREKGRQIAKKGEIGQNRLMRSKQTGLTNYSPCLKH